MANTFIKERSFVERGYYYNKPTRLECIEMGWHRGHCNMDIVKQFDEVRSCAAWVKESVWWQDYVLFAGGEVYFKYEQDLIMFTLKWA